MKTESGTPVRTLLGWRLAGFVLLVMGLCAGLGYVPLALMMGWDWPLAFIWHLPRSFVMGYDHGKVGGEILRCYGNLLLVALAYNLSRVFIRQSLERRGDVPVTNWTRARYHASCLLLVLVLAVVLREGLGSDIEDADPLRGGGEVVTDREVTERERREYGVILLFQILPAALFGVHVALKNYVVSPDLWAAQRVADLNSELDKLPESRREQYKKRLGQIEKGG